MCVDVRENELAFNISMTVLTAQSGPVIVQNALLRQCEGTALGQPASIFPQQALEPNVEWRRLNLRLPQNIPVGFLFVCESRNK